MKTIEELREIMEVPVIDNAYKATEKYVKENFPEFHSYVISSHPEVVGERVWSRKLYLCLNNLENEPVCKECGNPVKFISLFYGYNGFCGLKCSNNNLDIKNKKEETCLKHFGVKNSYQSEEIKEKIRETNLKRFGVEYSMQSPIIQEKSKQTCLIKFGVENPMQSPIIQEKSKQTCIKKYKSEYIGGSKEIQEKLKQTNLEKIGVEYPFQSPEIQKKVKQTMLEKHGVEWYCVLVHPQIVSKFETKYLDYIEELIKSLGYTLIRNTYNILKYYEVDGYIPELNLAIEFNGSYWHSLENKSTKQWLHKYKFKECIIKGINLLQVWDDWSDAVIKELLKDFILGNDLNKYKKILYPELHDREWPCDLGSPSKYFDLNNIQEHKIFHNKFECYDSGLVVITP